MGEGERERNLSKKMKKKTEEITFIFILQNLSYIHNCLPTIRTKNESPCLPVFREMKFLQQMFWEPNTIPFISRH